MDSIDDMIKAVLEGADPMAVVEKKAIDQKAAKRELQASYKSMGHNWDKEDERIWKGGKDKESKRVAQAGTRSDPRVNPSGKEKRDNSGKWTK